jgi:truncated hemoglobin YjbI
MARKHVISRRGQVILLEEVTEEGSLELARRFYREIGGADFFVRLSAAFYRLVVDDPLIGPLFAGKSAEEHARRLTGHFERMYGTPDLSEGWNPRFIAAHLGSVISNQHRRRWLDLFRAAGEEIGAPEPRFSDFMSTMTNGSGAVTAASRGAAIARGQRLDREGNVIGVRRTAGPGGGAASDDATSDEADS